MPDPTLDYPPYSGDDSACPKCATGTLASEYHVSTRWLHHGALLVDPEATEWQLRRCYNCGFERPEQCADAADPDLPDWERELLGQKPEGNDA